MSWLTGNNLMFFLVGVYALTCATFIAEGNWPKAMYWASAASISISVIWMK